MGRLGLRSMNKPALLAGSMAPLPKGEEKRKNEPNDVYTEAQRKRAALLFGFFAFVARASGSLVTTCLSRGGAAYVVWHRRAGDEV